MGEKKSEVNVVYIYSKHQMGALVAEWYSMSLYNTHCDDCSSEKTNERERERGRERERERERGRAGERDREKKNSIFVIFRFWCLNGIVSSSLALLRSAANNNDMRDEKTWYGVMQSGKVEARWTTARMRWRWG